MHMCVSWHLFTLASTDYSPQTLPQHKHTHTHMYLQSKGKEVWIMLALRDGQANQTHLETIADRALEERKVAGRGERQGGVENHRWGGAVQLQSVVRMPIHTQTHLDTNNPVPQLT